jgi:hypothetical protein
MDGKRTILAFVVLVATCAAAGAEVTRRVSSVGELRQALGPNRTVVLAPGSYAIPANGRQLTIASVTGLTLRGERGAEIVAEASDLPVLTVRGAQDLTLERIVLRHAQEDGCGAAVIEVSSSTAVAIRDCELQGSGALGIDATDCDGITLTDSVISGCSAGAIYATSVSSLVVDGSEVRDNGAYPLLSLSDCRSATLRDSAFLRNTGDAFVAIDGDGEEVQFVSCEITGNTLETFAAGGTMPLLHGTQSRANKVASGFVPASAEDEWTFHAHEASGLGFTYPGSWSLETGDDGFVGIRSPDDQVGLALAKLYQLTDTDDVNADFEGVLARALETLRASATESGDEFLPRESEAAIPPGQGVPSQVWRGAAMVSGVERPFVLRLILVRGEVYAALAVFETAVAQRTSGADVERIIGSFWFVGGEE